MLLYFLIYIISSYYAANNGYVNSIYYLGSGMPSPYDFSKLDLNTVTHIKYAFANITGNKAILSKNEAKQGSDLVLTGHLGKLIKIKQEHRHIKLGISILGDYGSMVPTKSGRSEFVASVIDIIKNFGFDFIDLDWEFPVVGFEEMGVKGNKDDAKYMVELLKEFHEQFKSKLSFSAFITIALPAPDYFLQHYDISGIDPYIQYYNTMTYDFAGLFSVQADYASNLYGSNSYGLSVDNSIKSMIKAGVPKNKLLIGIPAYASTFRNCESKKFPSNYDKIESAKVGERGYIPVNKVDWSKVEEHWNDTLEANWGYFPQYKMLLSYDNVQSVDKKVNYLKENELKGLMVWALHQDFPVGDKKSLVAASVNSLGKDNLEKSDNNIEYPDSPYANVKDPKFKVTISGAILIHHSFHIYCIYISFILILIT